MHEVDMNHPVPLYRLVSADLLRTLMRRTGTGAPVSVRELAALAGIPHGTVGNLLTREQEAVSANTAHRISAAIGVDVLILWLPAERAAAHLDRPTPVVAL
ncbi:helix-turn-helix transcriptional regulator [Streptomyces sp. HNM0645]|uniref:helix-turn-helix domain-containing protein n=1 Tax=Streptomyces sp. HNM0645 TaxID=2782343 RepID=UPI0024B82DE1|nr:helix-turn-helix transcriptional regulator [Streptomyces sp. HNM0645]MDI9885358.1 helix-turn-helix transcriptional regulator [Streptomyces sp. HNM0645]